MAGEARSVDDDRYSSEQAEFWNSPEMRDARAHVTEFCRRARQTSPAEGEEFLTRLSRLPAEEMHNWLERYQSRRMRASRGREIAELARLLRIGRSLSQQQAKRQAADNIADLRNQSATERAQAPQQFGFSLLPNKEQLVRDTRLQFDPLEAVVDPSSPRGLKRKQAAAASLPGDLPRSDPRNFIRGEAGVDFGEWATTKNAVPPTAAPANTASTPLVAAPLSPDN